MIRHAIAGSPALSVQWPEDKRQHFLVTWNITAEQGSTRFLSAPLHCWLVWTPLSPLAVATRGKDSDLSMTIPASTCGPLRPSRCRSWSPLQTESTTTRQANPESSQALSLHSSRGQAQHSSNDAPHPHQDMSARQSRSPVSPPACPLYCRYRWPRYPSSLSLAPASSSVNRQHSFSSDHRHSQSIYTPLHSMDCPSTGTIFKDDANIMTGTLQQNLGIPALAAGNIAHVLPTPTDTII